MVNQTISIDFKKRESEVYCHEKAKHRYNN